MNNETSYLGLEDETAQKMRIGEWGREGLRLTCVEFAHVGRPLFLLILNQQE